MNMLQNLRKDTQTFVNPQKATFAARFFKTKKGEYGYGDLFLGLTVPQLRTLAKTYKNLPLGQIQTLLKSKYHEERLIALFIMVDQFKKGDEEMRKKIYHCYLGNTQYINNWDLVDSSADKIVGQYLIDRPQKKAILKTLAESHSVWERRIAMLATYQFIKKGEYNDAFLIAELLLSDTHDLIHKAVGWMLREIGNRCGIDIEEAFLKKHYKKMPRTALRYAIEKLPREKRKMYLLGKI